MRRVSPVLLVLFSILTFCGTAASAEHFGADRHAAAGVKCSACHGSGAANPKMKLCKTQILENPIFPMISKEIRMMNMKKMTGKRRKRMSREVLEQSHKISVRTA